MNFQMYLHKPRANSTDLESQFIFNCDNWTYLVGPYHLVRCYLSSWNLSLSESAGIPLALEHNSRSCLRVPFPTSWWRPEQRAPRVSAYLPSCQEQRSGNTTWRHTGWGRRGTGKTRPTACQYRREILHNQPDTGSLLHLPSTAKLSCSLTNMITIFQPPNNFIKKTCKSHLSYCVKGLILIFHVLQH